MYMYVPVYIFDLFVNTCIVFLSHGPYDLLDFKIKHNLLKWVFDRE